MRRLSVVYRPAAVEDAEDIFRYIIRKGGSARVAMAFVRRIRARCSRIGDAPWSGRPRDDLAVGLRTIAFERVAVIAYLVSNDQIVVTNIFYGGRDIDALYPRGEDDENS
ncbi:type II toxin-antitoxin system RelE/ParE family toxin [Salinarimonas sp.]|uniref:type II toxin-antitoxin system RelE/ParE family toxin n=1 Tax=Salinarimonas sp. TaxID=2766526 RepID=UPI00391A7CBC